MNLSDPKIRHVIAQEFGAAGGNKRRLITTPERRKEIAKQGAAIRWANHTTLIERVAQLEAQLSAASADRADARRLDAAIKWALGMDGEFRPRESGEGAYWWRKELRERALSPIIGAAQSAPPCPPAPGSSRGDGVKGGAE